MAKKKKKIEKPKEYTRRQLSQHKKTKRRQRIVFISGVSIITIIILLIVGGWFITEFIPLHRTMLKVNGVKFNVGYYIDVMKVMRQNDSTMESATLAYQAVQEITEGEIVRQGAEKLGITVSKDEIKIGMKVKAVWKPENERTGSITDIKYFKPAGGAD